MSKTPNLACKINLAYRITPQHIYIYGQGLAMDLLFGHFCLKCEGVSEFWGPKFLGNILPKIWDPQNWLFGVLATRK